MALTEVDWDYLIDAIKSETCTPFIGPEICSPYLLTDKDIAKKWAKEYKYPLDDSSQLSRVAQFLDLQGERPSFLIKSEIQSQDQSLYFDTEKYKDSAYEILAKLNLPIYITTNYDHFMEIALEKNGRDPHCEYCV